MRFKQKICRYLTLPYTRLARRYSVDRRGAIAVVVAVLIVPLVGAVGLAVDYSRALALRSTAQTAADGAALLAVNVAKKELMDAPDSRASRERAILEGARQRGLDFFNSYIDGVADGDAMANLVVSRNNEKITARLDYSMSIRTTLGRVLGYDKIDGNATTDTISSLPLNYDIFLLLDVSHSMGLAATEADMFRMFDATVAQHGPAYGCVFGCHVTEGTQRVTNVEVARANGVRMRIDVLRDAVKDLANAAKASERSEEGAYRVGLATFHNGVDRREPLTDNMDTIIREAERLDLAPNPLARGDSYIRHGLSGVRRIIGRAGRDGLSRATAKKFVFLVTDGVVDEMGACAFSHCTGPIDVRDCRQLKDADVTLGVLYTTYLPVRANLRSSDPALDWRYSALVAPFADRIAPELRSCASPGWFFEASDESGIRNALGEMFNQIVRPPTLLN